MNAVTRIGVMPWPLLATLVAIAVVAPGLPAQEVDPLQDGLAAKGPRFGVFVGVRGELTGLVPSPGASLDLVWNDAKQPIWVSVQLLAQMLRWKSDDRPPTGHDIFLGRLRLGLGKRQGPSIYELYEKGRGTIRKGPSRGNGFDLAGVGLGVGWTAGRVSTSAEATIGTQGGYQTSSPGLVWPHPSSTVCSDGPGRLLEARLKPGPQGAAPPVASSACGAHA